MKRMIIWLSKSSYLGISVKELQGAFEGKTLNEVITDVLKGKWDHERAEFSFPPLMTVDVDDNDVNNGESGNDGDDAGLNI